MDIAPREKFDIPVETFDGKSFTLRATRLINKGKQPVILWEGFYQNGIFFDLAKGEESIAEYVHNCGYDVWIIDSRGNGGSTGKRYSTSMDDFAATDIPAVIYFVNARTNIKPVYIGHSQGGNTALMSLMGACKTKEGNVFLSDQESAKRQAALAGLVTLGSYLDFTFNHTSSLQNFVQNGIVINIFCRRMHIISSTRILLLLKILKRLPVPVPLFLREAMSKSFILRILLFPLTIILNIISTLNVWSFLYHIPNVNRKARINIFYRTMQATYWGILAQYQRAILYEKMMSLDGKVNYSENYHKIKLPVSVVTMEYDTLADSVETKKVMFPKLGSPKKYFTEWKGQGHEDFVMNRKYFHLLIDAIKILNLK